MSQNLKKIIQSIFIALFILVLNINYSQASHDYCEYIEVDKNDPIYTKFFIPYSIEREVNKVSKRDKLSPEKAKGKVGELVARNSIETGAIKLKGKKLVSIFTLFDEQGCTVQEFLRSKADQGIDDIFVVVRESDGWIDQRYNPIFHEAKYDGRCSLQLKDTITLCKQMSFQWLDGNLRKADKRTGKAANFCFDEHNEFFIQSCSRCRAEFIENVQWLMSMLKIGHFHRTASVLCANGILGIYKVNN